jgi:hypothetical protein
MDKESILQGTNKLKLTVIYARQQVKSRSELELMAKREPNGLQEVYISCLSERANADF